MKTQIITLILSFAIIGSALGQTMKESLADSGVQGGIIVHIGCGDGKETAKMNGDEKFLVCGLDTDASKIAEAKKHIAKIGSYGKCSAEKYDGKNLPFGDNTINLVIAEKSADISIKEIERALVPNGVLLSRSSLKLPASSSLIKEKKGIKGFSKYSKDKISVMICVFIILFRYSADVPVLLTELSR